MGESTPKVDELLAGASISDMPLIPITRHADAKRINEILNHPAVRPWVADENEGLLDISGQVENRNNVLLVGSHGACMFFKLMPGVYEVHTQVLPEGRGAWTRQLTHACVHWMFTRTDAFEILTRVPRGHLGARTAAVAQKMKYEFTREEECRFRGSVVDVDVYSLLIQDWISTADELEKVGRMFHEGLHQEARRLGITDQPHKDDPNHNRYVGACYEMAIAGLWHKAVVFYNRWALVCRHSPISLVSTDPPIIKFDVGYLTIKNGEVEVFRGLA